MNKMFSLYLYVNVRFSASYALVQFFLLHCPTHTHIHTLLLCHRMTIYYAQPINKHTLHKLFIVR